MKLRHVALPLLVAACIGVGAGTARATVGGPVCNVPTDYVTIQAAVSDPGCTVINVAPGVYNEQVTIGRSLTLNGAQAGVDARTRSGAESVITNSCGAIQVEADNVVIDGFTIQGATDPGFACFFSGIWSNPGFAGTNGGLTIVNNIIQNNISGIELDSNCTYPTLVRHNLIRNNSNPGPGNGNGIQTNFGLCNATIDSNTFSGDISSSVLVDTPSSNVNVTNNQLVAGANEGIAFLDVANSSISGNVSLGTASTSTIDLFGGNSNVAVNGNVLANGMRGIQVENPYGVPYGVPPNVGITAHTNCISGNAAAGLEEDSGGHTGALSATNNWWGRSSGPTIASNPGGTGDVIIDADGVVSYSPFTTSQPPAPCPVVTPRDLKQGVLATLQGIGPTGNKDTDKKIADAISHLQKSLDPSLWVDGSHLDPKKGDKVFDEEKAAVDSLTDIKKPSPSLAATIASSVQTLTSADRSLATTAISESTDPKKIAQANKELAAGDSEAAKGHFEQAIDHYKNAWKQVQKG